MVRIIRTGLICRRSRAVLRLFGGAVLSALFAASAPAAVVLQYHHISDKTPRITSVTPEHFLFHLEQIEKHGFVVVPLAQLVSTLQRGLPLPDKAVAITFDDGYLSVYEQAYPLLKARGWPFTVFVNTYSVDAKLKPFLNWAQLREMVANGASIANHTDTHAQMVRYFPGENYAAWRSRITSEVMTAQMRITAEIGSQLKLLAYPYGEYNEQVKGLLRELDYIGFGQQSGALAAYSDLQALPRFPFGGDYGHDGDFLAKLNSLPMPLSSDGEAIKKRDEGGREIADVVLPKGVGRPILQLHLQNKELAKSVRCYASGQGAIEMRADGPIVQAQAGGELPPGRSRYNCTAPSNDGGRFYWFSQMWIRKLPNGDWYDEPQYNIQHRRR